MGAGYRPEVAGLCCQRYSRCRLRASKKVIRRGISPSVATTWMTRITQLAGLPADRIRPAAGHGQLCRTDSDLSAGSLRRRLGGSPRPPAGAGLDADLAMVQSLALARSRSRHRITIPGLVLSVFQGCINAFDMPGRQSFMVQMVEDRARPLQRHRHQFVDGQRGAAGGAVAGRHVDRRLQRGLVLSHRRHQLHRGHRLAAA